MTQLDGPTYEEWLAAPKPPAAPNCPHGNDNDYRTSLALKGQFPWSCDYSNMKGSGLMTAAEIEAAGCCGYISCIYTVSPGCKVYQCLSPGACARLGGQNLGELH